MGSHLSKLPLEYCSISDSLPDPATKLSVNDKWIYIDLPFADSLVAGLSFFFDTLSGDFIILYLLALSKLNINPQVLDIWICGVALRSRQILDERWDEWEAREYKVNDRIPLEVIASPEVNSKATVLPQLGLSIIYCLPNISQNVQYLGLYGQVAAKATSPPTRPHTPPGSTVLSTENGNDPQNIDDPGFPFGPLSTFPFDGLSMPPDE
ncbi:MAG: hypothetical protein M1840_001970 [Geoglossum simile]|nr:MAG: hypothetical protein M1840_001970 [Geoglossum simile]